MKQTNQVSKAPIDWKHIETSLVAYCMLRPDVLDGVAVELLDNEMHVRMIEFAKSIKTNGRPILINMFRSITKGEHVPGYVLDEVYSRFADISRMDPAVAEAEYLYCLDQLKDRVKRADLAMELEHAQNMIMGGNVKEGLLHVKSLDFCDGLSDLPNTREGMKQSILESNGFLSGINAIDDRTNGLLRGNMMLIGGDSGSMKTMTSLWVIIKILMENPEFTCLYFEKEMPVKDINRRLVTWITATSTSDILAIQKIRDPDERKKKMNEFLSFIDETIEREDTTGIIKNNRLITVPADEFDSAADMFAIMQRYKPTIWCLDYYTMLSGTSGGKDKSKYEGLVEEAKILKNLTTNMDNFGIVLAQTKQEALAQKSVKIPELGDFEYGNTLKMYSAYAFTTFYPKQYYHAHKADGIDLNPRWYWLIGKKNRHDAPFDVPLLAYPEHMNFAEPMEADLGRMESWKMGYVMPKRKDR